MNGKIARDPKTAHPGRENGARVEFFKILGQNAKIAQGAQGARKIKWKKMQNFANIFKDPQTSANMGKHRRKSPYATSTYPTPI